MVDLIQANGAQSVLRAVRGRHRPERHEAEMARRWREARILATRPNQRHDRLPALQDWPFLNTMHLFR